MKQLRIAILWHMHQPDYRDPVAGQTLLPWTYLHAVKDYGEMLKTAGETEQARMTFNLVPTLVEQLDRYVDGTANDHWLNLAAADPAGLDAEQRGILIQQFFSVHHERHIHPYPRYRELASRRDSALRGRSSEFRDQDLRDLQVWFLLAWSGHHLGQSELVGELRRQGELFGEGDKAELLALYDREVAGVIELYRELEARGQIEISVTPYAHPILPLLCGNPIAREATPGIPLPNSPYRHPEDAHLQVRYGLDLVARRLGPKRRGMWPAEGAVSEEALSILQQEGAAWAASDEAILAKSLPDGLAFRSNLYQPYAFADLPLIFRDRELSDRIGFVYAHWHPERAAGDLIGHLVRAADAAPDGLLALILDGENCWERYQDNGYPFLSTLYRGIIAHPRLRLTTVSEALAELKPKPLARIAPGSWINGDFGIWIGHPEENRAWDLLERGRADAAQGGSWQAPESVAADAEPGEALLHLLRAEGSDWFWWYGDDHVTAQADLFDRLFRRHLEALYRCCERPVPADLDQPIKPPRRKRRMIHPAARFTPQIDGRVSDYFEWLAAGRADLQASGSMHAGHGEFNSLWYGYDERQLYLRLDPNVDLSGLVKDGAWIEIQLQTPQDWLIRFPLGAAEAALHRAGRPRVSGRGPGCTGRIVEFAVPLAPLKLAAGIKLLATVLLCKGSGEIARWPVEGPLELRYLGQELDTEAWLL